MDIISVLRVELSNLPALPIIYLKQGDTGRKAAISLLQNGVVQPIGADAIRIYMKKPDGTKVYKDCQVSDGNITVEFDNQMTAVAGDAQIEFQASGSDGIVSTPIAIARILPTNIDDSAIESANEFTALETALAQTNSLLQNLASQDIDFETADFRQNIASGESLATMFGKIAKYLGDLQSAAYNQLANNLTTTNQGYVLDARQGKILQDQLDNIVTGSAEAVAINSGDTENITVTISGETRTPARVIASLYNSAGAVGEITVNSYTAGGFTATIKNNGSDAQWFRTEYIAIFEQGGQYAD